LLKITLALLLGLTFLSCSSEEYFFRVRRDPGLSKNAASDYVFKVRRYASQVKDVPGGLRIGASEKELTPLPGYPLAGFGGEAKVGLGIWSHLYAHAVCLQDESGDFFILVSCDLWTIPAGLADKACEIAASSEAYRKISRDRVIISATHTHASQGNYTSTRAYNILAAPGVGFDKSLFQAMAKRISEAIREAYDSRTDAILCLQTTQVKGLTRNRSFEAFLENNEATTILNMNGQLGDKADPKFGVNQKLSLLVAFRRSDPLGAPIAVLPFFAMHQTVLGMHTPFYHADVFGVSYLHIKNYLQNKYDSNNTVVAFFNGEEGDVSANWEKQNHKNVESIGLQLADNILIMLNDPTAASPTEVNGHVKIRFKQIPLPYQPVSNDIAFCGFGDGGGAAGTSKQPDIGYSAIGGSEDGYNGMHGFLGLFKEANPGICSWNGHGHKKGIRTILLRRIPDDIAPEFDNPKEAAEFLMHEYEDYKQEHNIEEAEVAPLLAQEPPAHIADMIGALWKPGFPESTPIGIYELGLLCLVPLPGEFTTVSGLRIRKLLNAILPSKEVLFLGLSNEYLAYFATPEEYNAQHYEGGFTLYGEASVPYITSQLGKLARSNERLLEDTALTYSPGEISEFGLNNLDSRVIDAFDEIDAFVDQSGATARVSTLPHFDMDVIPDDVFWDCLVSKKRSVPVVTIYKEHKGIIEPLTQPLFFPLSAIKDSCVINNYSSTSLATIATSGPFGSFRWRVIWLDTSPFRFSGDQYQFVAEYANGRKVKSAFFRLDKFPNSGLIPAEN
jgi:hypothetical protein